MCLRTDLTDHHSLQQIKIHTDTIVTDFSGIVWIFSLCTQTLQYNSRYRHVFSVEKLTNGLTCRDSLGVEYIRSSPIIPGKLTVPSVKTYKLLP